MTATQKLLRMLAILIPATAFTLTYSQTMTTEEKIADALSAGPASITDAATIMDWPASEGAEMMVLREGTNGWVCQPSNPATLAMGYHDPWCIDVGWQAWFEALITQTEPVIEQVGTSYMFAGGYGSNTDPYATAPTDDDEWHVDGPHIMTLVPDRSALEGMTSDHTTGGPYVMYPGTPYAHIMVPVELHALE
jgi:hypothetical protein